MHKLEKNSYVLEKLYCRNTLCVKNQLLEFSIWLFSEDKYQMFVNDCNVNALMRQIRNKVQLRDSPPPPRFWFYEFLFVEI